MRVKGGVVRRRKHKKILQMTKGYRMSKSKLYRVAHEAYMHAGQYSYNDRKKRLGDFRRLWTKRINAALTAEGMKYKDFMGGLKKSDIKINRKMLADLAVNNPDVFSRLTKSL